LRASHGNCQTPTTVVPGAQLEAVPLTTLPGQEISPSFSPNGSEVAFGWDGENNGAGFDLYIKVIGTDKPLRLTNHPVPWLGVAWSPDGRLIAVHRMDKENGGIFLVPALGGSERKLVVTDDIFPAGASISWSPNGKQLAFVAHRLSSHVNSAQLLSLSLDTLERKPIETGCDYSYDPAFSPDGNTLAYACTQDGVWISLCMREMRTGKNTRLLAGLADINGITWSHDGARIIFSRTDSAFIISTGGDLWQVTPGKNGSLQKIPIANDAASPAVSSSGDRLAYAKSRIIANLWSVDLTGSQAHAHILAPSTRQQYDPVISPDGKKIAFMSDRSGGQQIWVCDIDGANPQQLTSFDQIVNRAGTPHWSPDSKQIAFDSRVNGEPNVYVVDADGGLPRKLETGTRMNSLPSWSRDGKWIYFANGATDSSLTIWRVAAAGGHATQLTKTQSSMPIESPDGQYVYFVRTTEDMVRLWRIRMDGSDEEMLSAVPPLRSNGYEWWLSETGIYFWAYPNGKPEVDFLDLRTSRIRRTYTPDKPPAPWLGGLSVSPNGKLLVYSRIDELASDLTLIENFR
jgi:Tol biopolymer transport system component